MVQSMVEVLQRQGHDSTTWHNVISTFRKYALGGITSNTTMLHAENLFQQARMLVGELSQRAQAFHRLQFEQQEEVLGSFGFSMAPAITLEDIGDAISKHFPALGLKRWYVMYYSDADSPDSISSPPPESYRLLLQYDQNKFQIPEEKSAIATGRLVPRGKTPEDHRYTAIVMPLSLASNRFRVHVDGDGTRPTGMFTSACKTCSPARSCAPCSSSSANRLKRKWSVC